MGFNNASSKRERMGSSPSERCMAREWSWSVGDVITCLIVGKNHPVNRRNSRRKKGGLNFPLKHMLMDRQDGLKARVSKFTTRAQKSVGRWMDSVYMILLARRKREH